MSGRCTRTTSRIYSGNGHRGHGGHFQSCNVAESRQLGCGNVKQNRQLGCGNINVNHGGHAICQENNRGHQPGIGNSVQFPSLELLNIFTSSSSSGSGEISTELENIFSSDALRGSQGIASTVSTHNCTNIQTNYYPSSTRKPSCSYRSRQNTCRGRSSHRNKNVPARDRYGRLIPNEFGNIVLSGDSDIENSNVDMSKTKEKEIVTPFQNQSVGPLHVSGSGATSPFTSLMTNSNEDKRMHRANKKYGYSEYGNNMYDIIIEDPLEDKVWPPQYMMPFV